MDPNADTVRSMSELLKKSEHDLDDPDGDLLPQITITGAELLEGHAARNGQSVPLTQLQHQDSITRRFQVTPAENNRDGAEVTNDSVGSSLGLSISGISEDEAYEISKKAKRRRCANPKELKLKVFVIILFALIITGLVLTFHFYNKKQNIVEVGKRIYFDEDSRELSVTNVHKKTVLTGHLGIGLQTHHLPFECFDDSSRASELCLLWKDRANLTVKYREQDETNCYRISWQSLSEDVIPWDCYEMDSAHWYGGGLSGQLKWPLQNSSFEKSPYVLGNMLKSDPFGPFLEPYWLTSNGVALYVHDGYPLHVSLNSSAASDGEWTDGQLCLYADYKDSPYFNPGKVLPALEYTICVAENIREVHKFAIQKIAQPPAKRPDDVLFELPLWSTWAFFKTNLDQQNVLLYADQINTQGYGHSMLIVDDGWQSSNGDLVFDEDRFPNATFFVKSLKEMNFLVSVGINPFADCDASAFQTALSSGYSVLDASGKVPGLINWWTGMENNGGDPNLATVIDMDESSRTWFRENLHNLLQKYDLDSLRAGGGESTFLPYKAHFHDDKITTSNQFAQRYADLVSEVGLSPQIETAYRSQHLAALPRLHDADSTFSANNGLQSVIPRFLTMGLLGYGYPIPDPAGGSYYMASPPSSSSSSSSSTGVSHGLDRELYIRWLAVQVFFPIMHLSAPPYYFDQEVGGIAFEFIQEHKKMLDLFLELAEESTKSLQPVVRPLWWIAPTDDIALTTDTEFMLGDKILVAPVLDKSDHRHIYLPAGNWKDRLEGGPIIVGPMTIENYSARLDMLPPHFELQDE